MWKEVAYFRVISRNDPGVSEETSKISVRIVGVPAGIRTGHVSNTSHKRYCLANFIGVWIGSIWLRIAARGGVS
jgi:hypothetical protein